MGISFDALPSSSPNMLPPKGTYIATIEKAEMKQGKHIMGNPPKPPYLNLQLGLKTADGKSVGKLFDILAESNHELVRFKIKRFVQALGLDFSGISFELSDLCKIAENKQIIVDVTHDEKSNIPKAVVDVFKNEIYYPISEAATIFGTEVNVPINAPDAEEENPFTDEGVDY